MAAMELKLELDSSFAFDGPTFSGGGEHGYSSASSFSSTSPTTDPFTPISGRSSPPYADVPADLDLSYYADGLPYCVTPPPTAAPGYFAMGSKMGLETDSKLDFQAPEGFYGTPPSFTDLSGLAFAEAGAMCSTPPQQTLYFGPMGDGAATTPGSMTPTSAYMLSGHHRMDAQPDLWHSDMDVGKPLAMFETLPPTGALPSPTPPRIANAVRRLFLDDAQQTSAHLQRQLLSNGAPRSQPKRNKGGKAVLPLGFEVSKVESPTHPCLHPDCHGSKRFKRLEHLKRHAKTHDPDVEYRRCDLCPRTFKARPDNYRQHLSLHMRPSGKNSRVAYFKEAKALYAQEMRKLQERKSPNGPTKRRASDGTI